MNNNDRKNKPHALTTLTQIKALADPLRYRVFEHLVGTPSTAKQVADMIGTKPTRLYHHFKVLEKAGLICKSKTRKKRGTVEKYYKAVSDRITIDPGLLEKKSAFATSMLVGVLQTTVSDLMALEPTPVKDTEKTQVTLKRLKIRLTQEKANELEQQLLDWIDTCETSSESDIGDEYRTTVVFYPYPAKVNQEDI